MFERPNYFFNMCVFTVAKPLAGGAGGVMKWGEGAAYQIISLARLLSFSGGRWSSFLVSTWTGNSEVTA
jgi:hypothetical protein